MLNALISPLTKIAGSVIDRVIPDKLSPKERDKIEAELKKEILQTNWKVYTTEVQDRDSARQLGQKELEKGNAVTNILAALHRPLWSLVCLALFVWTVLSPQFGMPTIELTEIHKGIMQSVIIFYFGGRSVEKVFNTIKNK